MGKFLSGFVRNKFTNQQRQQQEQRAKEPETQEERILDFQKKSFETSDAEDVEFEEVK